MRTKDTSTNIQLVIIYISDERFKFCVNTMLIEYSNTITWDEDELRELYYRRRSPRRSGRIVKDTWLLDDVIVLMIVSKWEEESRIFEIIISGWIREYRSIKPLRVSPKM
jgi:hypothetical protein